MPALRNGCEQAYAQLYNHLYPALHAYATKMIKNEDEAVEIVQNIFIKIWQRRCDFPSFPMLRSFMYKSTRNTCINYINHQKYKNTVIHSLQYLLKQNSFSEPYSNEQLDKADKLQQCKKLINTLPEKCREIMELYFDEGLPSNVIAQRLNKSVHTIRNQRLRGIQLVKCRMNASVRCKV